MNLTEEILSEKDRYAMYLRKSRADFDLEAMGEGETLARHRERLYDLAHRMDITPDQIIVYEEIVSGESIQDRPEMQRLLEDVYLKKFRGVLVVEVERLARGNTKDQGEVSDAFQYSDTKIITPAKVYDPHNEFDQEYFEFGLFMSRREYKTIRRRMGAGKEQSAMEGNYLLPQRTLGYNIVKPTKKDRYLVENQEEAKIVRMIFDWFTEEGKTTGWIAQKLTAMGIRTIKGKAEWHRNSVRDMLTNVAYIGMIRWGEYRVVKKFDHASGEMKKVRQKASESDVVLVKGKHKSIISQEQFDKVQEIMALRSSPVKVVTEMINPLAGLMWCKDCGRAITWIDYKDGRQIRYTHARSVRCKKKSLMVDVVFDALETALRGYIQDFEIKASAGGDQNALIQHQQHISAMEEQLARTEKRKCRLFDSWEADDGTYTRDEFVERKTMYTRQIDELKGKIQAAKKNAPAPVDYSERIVTLRQAIDCLRNPNIPAKDKNAFLKTVISRINFDSIDHGRQRGGSAVLDVHLI